MALRSLPRARAGLLLASLALCVLSLPAAAGQVVIADASGTRLFTEIQAAVDAAVDGDVILVSAGDYAEFSVRGKSVSIFATPENADVRCGGVGIFDLSGHTVGIVGLTARGGPTGSEGLACLNNSGRIRLQDCSFFGGFLYSYSARGARIEGSSDVVLVDCYVEGAAGTSATFGGDGADGLTARSSDLALYDCIIQGGRGGYGDDQGGDGGNGLVAQSWWLFAAGSEFRGGAGGDSDLLLGGAGGDGLVVESGGEAQLLDNTHVGGAGGFPAGAPGLGLVNHGIANMLPGTAHLSSAVTLGDDRAKLDLTVSGTPGERVFLSRSSNAGFLFDPAAKGVWTTAPAAPFPQAARPIGVVPLSGILKAHVDMPLLSSSETHRRTFIQAWALDAQQQITLASPAIVALFNGDEPPDCDGNGVQDYVDVLNARPNDCNGNLVPDDCDVASGASPDFNANGVPDECEVWTWHVDAGAPPGGSGNPGDPFRTILEGISAAKSGDTIIVADGLYTGPGNRDLVFQGKVLRLRSANGPDACIIDCEYLGRAFDLSGSSGSRLEGFTVTRGSATSGGGIFIFSANVVVENCRVTACIAGSGGGMYLRQSSSVIRGCELTGNVASYAGGGAHARCCPAADFVDCLFEGNWAGSHGGGIRVTNSNDPALLTNCRILGNSAAEYGGGIAVFGVVDRDAVRVQGSLIARNSAPSGAGIRSGGAGMRLEVSTVVANVATVEGGGMRITDQVGQSPDVHVSNTILWGNSAPMGHEISVVGASTLTITYSDVQGGAATVAVGYGSLNWAAGNLDVDPAFVAPMGPAVDAFALGADWRLSLISPLIDAGSYAFLPPDRLDLDGDGNIVEPLPFDLDGLPRRADIPTVPDTGAGAPPIVDLGAYERQP